MAFGFIKTVFSFGRKEVVEEKPDEAASLPPPDSQALERAVPEPAHSEVERPADSAERDVAEEMLQIPPAASQATPAEPPAHPVPEDEKPPASAEPGIEAEPPPPVVESPPEASPKEREAPAGIGQPEPHSPVPADQPVAVSPEEEVREDSFPPLEKADGKSGTPDGEEKVAAPAAPAAPEPMVPPFAGPAPSGEDKQEAAPASPPAPSGENVAGKVTVAKAVARKVEPAPAPEPQARKSWFQRMREGLARSSRELTGNIAGVFTKRKLDEDTLQDLEDILIRADLGVETALRVTDALASSRYGKTISDEEVRAVMAEEISKVLTPVAQPLELDLSHKPHVILVVGVNGTGKTTTIGKLAAKLTEGGLSVMLAAGDTFRAAAIEQLKIWGERTGSPVIASKLGADAAGLAYDAFKQAREAGSDVLIIDTAGRLQNKAELMAELEKVVRVLGKLDPEAPHTVLQTVDATTGQNALNQVEIFRNVAGVNGLVMTKLDGTARGGILVAIAARHKLPVYFIGVGEQVDDLEPFSASDFARAIAGLG